MIKFSPAFIQNLKDSITLSELIKPSITQWDRKKSNPSRQDWWAPCPFHSEKSASFHIDDRKNFYHCFGCGAHGGAVDWMTEFHKKSFPEAIEELAQITGVSLPAQTPQMQEKYDATQKQYDLLKKANEFYQQQLFSPVGQEALNYLKHKRGLSDNIIQEFSLGYAPAQRNLLLEYLKKSGFSPSELTASGLMIVPEDNKPSYDRFRNRVMFPITNRSGKAITFGGRALDKNEKAKYLNGAQSPIFNKSHHLYNLQNAIRALKKYPLIVSEGYMDVIALHKYGFKTAVAPMGTALTEEQIKLMWRFCNEPILCFDGDKAGMGAAWRAIDRVLPILTGGVSLRFIFLPDGLDPDDYLNKYKKQDFEDLISKSYSLSHILFLRETLHCGMDTPERIMGTEKKLSEAIYQIKDARLKDLYLKDMKQRISQFTGENPPPQSTNHYRNKDYGQKTYSSYTKRSADYSQNKQPSLALSSWKKSKHNHASTICLLETKIIGVFLYCGDFLEEKEFDILESISFQNPESSLLQAKIIEKFWERSKNTLALSQKEDMIPFDEKASEKKNRQITFFITDKTTAFNQSIISLRFMMNHLNLHFINPNQAKSISVRLCNELTQMHHKLTVLKEEISHAQKEFFLSSDENSERRLLSLKKLFNDH